MLAHKRHQQAAEGEDLLMQIVGGASIEQVMARTGLPRWDVLKRISTLRAVAPEAHRQMVDGMRMLLGQLALDDIMHWRPLSRMERTREVETKGGAVIEVRDHEAQKIAAAAYKDAKDTVIKVFGLQSQTIELGQATNRPPLTTEELAAKSVDPDVANAIEAVVVAVHNVTKEAA